MISAISQPRNPKKDQNTTAYTVLPFIRGGGLVGPLCYPQPCKYPGFPRVGLPAEYNSPVTARGSSPGGANRRDFLSTQGYLHGPTANPSGREGVGVKRLVTSVVLLLATTVFAQIQDRGLEKSVDEFTGTVLCEQWVVNLADPGRITLRTILDERGVITFSLIRSTATSGVINIPWAWTEQKGVLLRFADGEVRGLYVENTHYDGNNQYANLITSFAT